jgi:4-hydroxybenzoate polyprenyltransferase
MLNKILPYIRLMRLERPIGTFLLLWPTLWALWLAGNGSPDPDIVVIFILGTIVMRAAGCIINDYADRDFDRHVSRTNTRPLTSGAVSTPPAMFLFGSLITIALILVFQLNLKSILLSIIALFLAVLYPFTKRFTQLPQCFLGLAFSMGIPMAYAALTDTIPTEAWLIFIGNFCWIVAYDTIYAMADKEEDLVIGVKSTAILFGKADKVIVGLLHTAAFTIIGMAGYLRDSGWHFYFGIGCAVCFAVYQQFLIKDRLSQKCFQAFLNNNWIGAMIYCGIVLATIVN